MTRVAHCVFQVEGLMDDLDFKAKVTRAEFEELCADLFERVPRPVQDALAAAEMSMVGTLQICSVGSLGGSPQDHSDRNMSAAMLQKVQMKAK